MTSYLLGPFEISTWGIGDQLLKNASKAKQKQVKNLEEESHEIERISWDAEDRLNALLVQAEEYYKYIQEKQKMHQEYLVALKDAQIRLARLDLMKPVRRGMGAVPITGSRRQAKPERELRLIMENCAAEKRVLESMMEKLRLEGKLLRSICETQIIECSLRADKQLPKEGTGTLDFLDYDTLVLGRGSVAKHNRNGKAGNKAPPPLAQSDKKSAPSPSPSRNAQTYMAGDGVTSIKQTSSGGRDDAKSAAGSTIPSTAREPSPTADAKGDAKKAGLFGFLHRKAK